MDAEAIIRRYALEPLPQEGGWFRRIYTAGQTLPEGRPLASAILFCITGSGFSALHRIDADEIFHFLCGAPAEMLQISPTGTASIHRLGAASEAEMSPVVRVPANHWQGMRLADGPSERAFALFSVTVHPAFEWDRFELGKRADMLALCPRESMRITALTRS